MFLLRHQLQGVLTASEQAEQVYGYLCAPGRRGEAKLPYAAGLEERFGAVHRSGTGERAFLLAVVDLYQTKVSTKMTMAAERLAVLAALTLPVTAISSMLGMNLIVNKATTPVALILALALMGAISLALLSWTRRQGWW